MAGTSNKIDYLKRKELQTTQILSCLNNAIQDINSLTVKSIDNLLINEAGKLEIQYTTEAGAQFKEVEIPLGDRVKYLNSLSLVNGALTLNYTDQDDLPQSLEVVIPQIDIKYNVLNYTELLTVTSQLLYDFAYVREDQGTAWLPGSLGGTFYGNGLYMWDGTSWIEDDTDVFAQLNTMLTTLSSIEGRLLDLEDSTAMLQNDIVGAEWISGLTFLVNADLFTINGVQYTAAESLVTLDPSDATLDRIDYLVATVGSPPTVGRVTGVASISPAPPDYDPETTYPIKIVLVKSLATVPSDPNTGNEATRETVFDEGTEWAYTLSAIRGVVDGTESQSGTVSINWTNPILGDTNTFTSPDLILSSTVELVTFYIKLKAAFGNSAWYVKFYSGNALVGSPYIFMHGSNGFSKTNLAWQKISITKADLNLPTFEFDKIQIYPYKAFSGYHLDLIELHTLGGSIAHELPEYRFLETTGTKLSLTKDGLTVSEFTLPTPVLNHSDLTLDDGKNPHGADLEDLTNTGVDPFAHISELPTVISNHSELTLDDGLNPHQTDLDALTDVVITAPQVGDLLEYSYGNNFIESFSINIDNVSHYQQEIIVSTYGEYNVIGSPYSDIDNKVRAGVVYVYKKINNVWEQFQILTASDITQYNEFGNAVCIWSDYIIIGNKKQNKIYIFKNINGYWVETQILTKDTEDSIGFGTSVSIYGNYIIIGAVVPNNNGQGYVYIFENINDIWTKTQKIVASDGSFYDYFGISVSIHNNVFVVGASLKNNFTGAAYIFKNINGIWSEIQKLTSTNPRANARFGNSVTVFGDYIAVGAMTDTLGTAYEKGCVEIFKNINDNWVSSQVIVSTDNDQFGWFGYSLSMYNNKLLIGDIYGQEISFNDDTYYGAAYLYKNINDTWIESQLLIDRNNTENEFGNSVCIHANNIIIGNGDNESKAFFFELEKQWVNKPKPTDLNDFDNIGLDSLKFDTTPSATDIVEGEVKWNADENTFDVGLEGGAVTGQLFGEQFIRGVNKTGITLPEVSAVYSEGRLGFSEKFALAKGDSELTSQVSGILTMDIEPDAFGRATTFGYVRKIKTNYVGDGVWGTTWALNDKLYVSKDVAGQITNVQPSAPHHSDYVGRVAILGNQGIGAIFVQIERHKTLKELSDVNGTPVTTYGQLPVYQGDGDSGSVFDFTENIRDYLKIANIPIASETLQGIIDYPTVIGLIQQTPSTVIGTATKLYLDTTSSIADNYTLSPTPSAYPETINTKATTSATSPVFLERFISGQIGKTSIAGGTWHFNIYAACSNLTGLNKILFSLNKRVIINGITGTWSGSGIIRTFTASSGTPFLGLTTTGNRISAPLIETPNQTGWVTVVNSSTQVTVNITDISYINEANVSLNAIYYYLFQAETQDMDSITVKRYEVDSVQPEITGLNETDRLVLALFAYTDQPSSRNISLYYGGALNYTNFEFPPDPLDLADLTNNGIDPYAHVSELPTPTPPFVPADHDLSEFDNLGVDPYAHVSELPTPTPPFIPADHDLSEFDNLSVDPYAHISELPTPTPPFVPADHDLSEFDNLSVDPFAHVSELPVIPPIPTKATATDIATGTDDEKFATSMALADAGVKRFHVGTTAPTDTTLIWINTSI